MTAGTVAVFVSAAGTNNDNNMWFVIRCVLFGLLSWTDAQRGRNAAVQGVVGGGVLTLQIFCRAL